MVSEDRDPTEQQLRRRLAAPLASLAWVGGGDHLDADILARHVAGELNQAQAMAVTKHLTVCDDGRCPALVREELAGLDAVRVALVGEAELSAPVVPIELKKTARTFECRDALWELFERLAREDGATVDQLINESMKQHARQRSYSQRSPLPSGVDPRMAPPGASAPPPGYPADRMTPPAQELAGPQSLARPTLPAPPASGPRSLPPLPPPPYGAPPPAPFVAGLPPAPPASPRGLAGGYGAAAAPPPPLFALYGGVRYPVDKDRFIIGRGKNSSDLVIKDPNISRQHAMVELVGGRYYMVDMGSTNGVLFEGNRIVRKVIGEGDRYVICDHEVFFSYR